MVQVAHEKDWNASVIATIAVVGWYGMFRLGELTVKDPTEIYEFILKRQHVKFVPFMLDTKMD